MRPVRQPRILVAEDDRVLQDLVAELLVEAGYDVTTASDGDEALKIVREQSPDLVLLDVMMPRMDGYAVCREIRAAGPAAPPVIFVTAHGNIKDRVTGLDLGAVDYLVKPFNPPELEARVRAALRTRAALEALAADGATDALTGLLSRGQIAGRMHEAVALARRHQRPLSCLILAIEDLADVVERNGAGAGDVLLREVARRLRGISRRSDVVAGGFDRLAPRQEPSLDCQHLRLDVLQRIDPVPSRRDPLHRPPGCRGGRVAWQVQRAGEHRGVEPARPDRAAELVRDNPVLQLLDPAAELDEFGA